MAGSHYLYVLPSVNIYSTQYFKKKKSSLSRYGPFLEGPVSQLVNASGAQTFVFSKTLIGMSVCSVKASN